MQQYWLVSASSSPSHWNGCINKKGTHRPAEGIAALWGFCVCIEITARGRENRVSTCPRPCVWFHVSPANSPESHQARKKSKAVNLASSSNDNPTGELQLPKALTAPHHSEQTTAPALPAQISPAATELTRVTAGLCCSHARAPTLRGHSHKL